MSSLFFIQKTLILLGETHAGQKKQARTVKNFLTVRAKYSGAVQVISVRALVPAHS
jgi:hypothetical protein